MTGTTFGSLAVGAPFATEAGTAPFWRKAGERHAVALHNGMMTLAVESGREVWTPSE